MTGARLFVAVELPPAVLKALEALQDDLKQAIPRKAARWTRPEGIHLTLKFLGDTPASQVEPITAALHEAAKGQAPFDLTVEGVGCFPNPDRPRVVWAGVGGDVAALRQLQKRVEERISPLGFPAEPRAFSPHLTLARAAGSLRRDESAAIGRAASEGDVGLLASWQVKSISLMRSELLPDGARYTALAQAALG